MQRKNLVAAVLVGAGLVAGTMAPASAAKPSSGYQPPVVNWIQPTVIAHADGTATVHAHYTCFGGDPTHLFIAVKQGPEVNATTHTSSQFANTFYSTNYNSDTGSLHLNCNGRMNNALFVLEPDPFFAFGHPDAPPLSAGTAFVQFCMFDSTNQGDDDPNGFASDYSMRKVVLG